MNYLALIHVFVALLIIGLSAPLAMGSVGPNRWYGIRIPEAFKSEARWFAINQYGGRLMIWWGVALGITAVIGLMLPKKYWTLYVFGSLGVILGGLALVIALIFYRAGKSKTFKKRRRFARKARRRPTRFARFFAIPLRLKRCVRPPVRR